MQVPCDRQKTILKRRSRFASELTSILALLDYEMPMMSGLEAGSGNQVSVPDVPIVLIRANPLFRLRNLVFVDAHSGLERRSTICCGRCDPGAAKGVYDGRHLAGRREMTRWADST